MRGAAGRDRKPRPWKDPVRLHGAPRENTCVPSVMMSICVVAVGSVCLTEVSYAVW